MFSVVRTPLVSKIDFASNFVTAPIEAPPSSSAKSAGCSCGVTLGSMLVLVKEFEVRGNRAVMFVSGFRSETTKRVTVFATARWSGPRVRASVEVMYGSRQFLPEPYILSVPLQTQKEQQRLDELGETTALERLVSAEAKRGLTGGHRRRRIGRDGYELVVAFSGSPAITVGLAKSDEEDAPFVAAIHLAVVPSARFDALTIKEFAGSWTTRISPAL